MGRSSHRICSVKKGILKNFANFTGTNMCWSFFLIKLQAPTQVFSCEICEIFKNTCFEEHLQTAASKMGRILFLFFFYFPLFTLERLCYIIARFTIPMLYYTQLFL